MSRIGASARRYYSDGITRVTDPFWKMKCNKCGHVFFIVYLYSRMSDVRFDGSEGISGRKEP